MTLLSIILFPLLAVAPTAEPSAVRCPVMEASSLPEDHRKAAEEALAAACGIIASSEFQAEASARSWDVGCKPAPWQSQSFIRGETLVALMAVGLRDFRMEPGVFSVVSQFEICSIHTI